MLFLGQFEILLDLVVLLTDVVVAVSINVTLRNVPAVERIFDLRRCQGR